MTHLHGRVVVGGGDEGQDLRVHDHGALTDVHLHASNPSHHYDIRQSRSREAVVLAAAVRRWCDEFVNHGYSPLTYDLDPRGVDGEQRAEVRDERGRVELRQRHLRWCDKGTGGGAGEGGCQHQHHTSAGSRYDKELTHKIPRISRYFM